MFINLPERSVIAFFFWLLVSGCDAANRYEYNYKITVNVEANGKSYPDLTIQQQINYKLKGWAKPLSGFGGDTSILQKGERPWRVSNIWKYRLATFTDTDYLITVKKITQDNFGQYFVGGKIISIVVQRLYQLVKYGMVKQVIPLVGNVEEAQLYGSTSKDLSKNRFEQPYNWYLFLKENGKDL